MKKQDEKTGKWPIYWMLAFLAFILLGAVFLIFIWRDEPPPGVKGTRGEPSPQLNRMATVQSFAEQETADGVAMRGRLRAAASIIDTSQAG